MKKLYVIGLGPGCAEGMTREAFEALSRTELICGYTVYIDLVHPLFPDTPVFTTPMTHELERCEAALTEADSGKTVAMVCSGDAGVYGMAGPILEMAAKYPEVDIEIISGLTAAISGAAVLGAPLMHDFCVISLSDLLTPWETIERRLHAAGEGDFCIAIYNPRSKKRADYLQRACEILLKTRSVDNAAGWVRNIGREGEEAWTGTLCELASQPVDMFTTVFVGNSQTKIIDNRMVTPRGYEKKQ